MKDQSGVFLSLAGSRIFVLGRYFPYFRPNEYLNLSLSRIVTRNNPVYFLYESHDRDYF